MKSAIILDTPTHRVTSWGNGLAYLVERKATRVDPPAEFFLQGDDALAFSERVFGQDVWDFGLLYAELFQPPPTKPKPLTHQQQSINPSASGQVRE